MHRCLADTSIAMNPEVNYSDGKHRMVNPGLAGGAFLDLGPYSLSWCFQAALACGAQIDSPKVLSAVKHYPTGVDETTTMVLTFSRDARLGGEIHAIATTSMRVDMDPDGKGTAGPCVRIQGNEGEIQVFSPSYRPIKTRIILDSGELEEKVWRYPGPGEGSGWYNRFGGLNAEGEGHGMFWEADGAAMALMEGRKEGRLESLNEVVTMMKVMDKVRNKGQGSSFTASIGNMIIGALNTVERKYTLGK